jgi:uncharacterized protein
MVRIGFILLLIAIVPEVLSQKVLHFTRTSGYDHNTREVSFQMFSSIAAEIGVEVIDDATGDTFSDLEELLEFDVIVFSNTSGNAILDATQRQNFEVWVTQGGDVLGIHAATDTYRHSTANGSNTGSWDLYAELIGGSVQEAPNHVNGTPLYEMVHLSAHPTLNNIPDPWEKEEEYYYWENGYLNPSNIPLLEVEETIGPNGEVNSYDAPRPMCWYRMSGTGRTFYTALGHAASNFTSDTLFRSHIRDALLWLLSGSTSLEPGNSEPTGIFYEDDRRIIEIRTSSTCSLEVIDIQGRIIRREFPIVDKASIDLSAAVDGLYFIRLSPGGVWKVVIR